MKKLSAVLATLLMVICAVLLSRTPAHADQNPAPVNAGVSSQSTFTCSASSLLAFPVSAADHRAYLLIQNEDASNTVIVKFNSTISGSEGILLQPKQTFEPHPALVGSIYCKSASGATLGIVEGSK